MLYTLRMFSCREEGTVWTYVRREITVFMEGGQLFYVHRETAVFM